MTNVELVEDIIKTIENELTLSTSTKYRCEDGTNINTDVGYVYDWFSCYKEILRKKYIK